MEHMLIGSTYLPSLLPGGTMLSIPSYWAFQGSLETLGLPVIEELYSASLPRIQEGFSRLVVHNWTLDDVRLLVLIVNISRPLTDYVYALGAVDPVSMGSVLHRKIAEEPVRVCSRSDSPPVLQFFLSRSVTVPQTKQ